MLVYKLWGQWPPNANGNACLQARAAGELERMEHYDGRVDRWHVSHATCQEHDVKQYMDIADQGLGTLVHQSVKCGGVQAVGCLPLQV